MKLRNMACAFVMVCAGLVTEAGAQSAYVLHEPISARIKAMGWSGVADNSDPSTVRVNPANVAGRVGIYAYGGKWGYDEEVLEDVWMGGGSIGLVHQREGSNTTIGIDLSYGRLDYGDTGGPTLPYDSYEDFMALAVGAAFALDDQWTLRAGIAAKRLSLNYGPASFGVDDEPFEESMFVFDAGAAFAYTGTLEGWAVTPGFGMALANAGPDIEYMDGRSDPQPTVFRFGPSVRLASPPTPIFGADVPVFSVVTNLEATEAFNDEPFSWAIGAELAVAEMFFVRAGTRDLDDDTTSIESESGWGVGVGLPVQKFRARFDYTKVSNPFQEDTFGFMAMVLF